MALGAITSLGVGSEFELQEMLESLREVDEAPITAKENDKAVIEEQLVKYDELYGKLINMKSTSLKLSLESSFIERSVTVSDEEVASATAKSGAEMTSHDIEVTKLASKSSWQSIGVESGSAVIYSPPDTGIASKTGMALSSTQTLSFTIGTGDDQQSVSVSLRGGSSLENIADAINTASANQDGDGGTYVEASIESGENGYYIRLKSTDTDTSANNQIIVSEGPDLIAPDISFSYQAGAENSTTYIAVPPGTSYSALSSIINSDPDNTGIKAAIIDDGSGENSYHLTLTAKETGEDNRIYLDGLNLEELNGKDGESLNAQFSVDGIEYQRQTNEGIEDVIDGMSLTIKKAGTSSVSVSAETETLKTDITSLVETFNEVVEYIKTNSEYDSEEDQTGPFGGASSIRSISNTLSSLMSSSVRTAEGKTLTLYDLGMEINRDGTITLDEDTFDEMLSSSPEDVAALFLGDSEREIEGLGDKLNDELRNMTSSYGAINAEKDAAEEKLTRLTESIETAQERLDKKYDILAEQFVQLDSYIGTLNSQATYLSSIFDSYNSASEK